MREWLRLKLLEKLGGYPDAESAINGVAKGSTEARRDLLDLAVKRLYNTVDATDILQTTSEGDWVFMGKVLPKGSRELLMAEAEELMGTKLWEVLNADIRYQANKAMFLKSRTELDIVAGKLWLHTLAQINKRLRRMIAGSGMLEPKKKG
jgi:hypothetical protein